MLTKEEFFNAIESGDEEKVQEGISEFQDLEFKGTDNLTPLGKAVYNGQVNTAQLLLNARASSNAMGKDGKTILQWARNEKDGDCAKLIMLYSYIDRIMLNAEQYKKNKITIGSCDVCSANVTEDITLTLSIDEIFESENYTNLLYKNSLQLQKATFRDQSKEKVLEYMKQQIKNCGHNDCFVVCNDCILRFFDHIVFGNFKDFLETSINEMMNSQE